MAEKNNDVKLFAEFPPVSTEEWEAKINADLKGASYEKKLMWRTLEGFTAKPYYRAEDLENLKHLDRLPGEFPFVRGNKKDSNDWWIRQDIEVTNPKDANKKALDILMKGVTSLGFRFEHGKELGENEFNELLSEIKLDAIETNFTDPGIASSVIEYLKKKITADNINAESVQGSVNFDPLSALVLRGNFCQSAEDSFNKAKAIFDHAKDLKAYKILGVGGHNFHNAGSSTVQELAFSLAAGAEYIYQLSQLGISVDEIAPKIKFNFAIGGNYFMEIAKFRAARMLWAKIVESFEPCCQEKAKMDIHAVTSRWNKTVYDPYVNMLRTQTEAMSAAIAGVNSMTVEAFNKIFEPTSDFSERIARNQQIMLKEEAYFDKVVDPSAGSYYIENLTDSIAQSAWALFQEIEEAGGFIEAFKKGIIQDKIAETAQKRDMNLALRKENLLGTNQFPNFSETLNKIATETLQPVSLKAENAIAEPIKLYRGAMAFEALRYKTDASGKRPKAYMLTIGNLNMRKARAQFSCNFFACAGFEVIDNNGFKTIQEGVDAAKAANADIVVLCSSDDEYLEFAPEACELLDGKVLVVAGAPSCMDDLKKKGIDNFIHMRSNVLEELKKYQELVGIK